MDAGDWSQEEHPRDATSGQFTKKELLVAAVKERMGDTTAATIAQHRPALSPGRLNNLPPDVEGWQRIKEHDDRAAATAEELHSYAAQHSEVSNGWVNSSASRGAMRLHAALEAMGVRGSYAPDDQKVHSTSDVTGYVQAHYALTQAALRGSGITSITVYRGITHDSPPTAGNIVALSARPASSWSNDANEARRFVEQHSADGRGFVVALRVPAAAIWSSPDLYYAAGSTRRDSDSGHPVAVDPTEYVVLGAHDAPATVHWSSDGGHGRTANASIGRAVDARNLLDEMFS